MSPENSTLSGGKSLMYRRLYLMMVSDRNLPTLCLTSPATSGCVAASVMNTRCRGEPRLCWNTEASILYTGGIITRAVMEPSQIFIVPEEGRY